MYAFNLTTSSVVAAVVARIDATYGIQLVCLKITFEIIATHRMGPLPHATKSIMPKHGID